MFNMTIEKQLNIMDRTLILGVPNVAYSLPKSISLKSKEYKVLGVSSGVKPPFVSLEIERTANDLVGLEIEA